MNLYQPMDVDELRRAIETHGPLYQPPDVYGFEATDVDGEHAVISWRNTFGEAPHGDLIAKLKKHLSRNGYEAKIGKPAKTTLIVRKVVPYVAHYGASALGNTMGPFESMVERLNHG